MSKTVWVIEFRNGSFFRDEEDDRGRSIKEARRWPTMEAVDDFVTRNEWLLWNGGCPIEICAGCLRPTLFRGERCGCRLWPDTNTPPRAGGNDE